MGRAVASLAIVVLVCACASSLSPSNDRHVSHPAKRSLQATGPDWKIRKASVMAQAEELCAKETMSSNVSFIMEDARAVHIEFYCEGSRASTHLANHIETLEKGIPGLNEQR